MARSSIEPRGRPMSADIFCCSCPACTLARFDRCLSPSDSLWDKRGCSQSTAMMHVLRCSPLRELAERNLHPALCHNSRHLLEAHAAEWFPPIFPPWVQPTRRSPCCGLPGQPHLLVAQAAVVMALRGAVGGSPVAALRLLLRKGRRRRRPIPPERRRLQQRFCITAASVSRAS